MHRWLSHVAFTVVAVLAVAAVPAQEQLDLGDMAQRMKRNQETLRQYTWDSRITYEVDGVQKRMDAYTVRLDGNGSLEKVQVSSTVDRKKIRRADGKKLSKKEREAAHDFAVEAKSQLTGYLNPMFAEKAVSTSTLTEEEDTLVLHSADVVKTGDVVEIALDRATGHPLTLRATSTIGDSPVTLEVRFDTLEYGPSHPVHSVTRSAWQGLELTITTGDSNYVSR